ncbi:type III ribulose-bisphosphate carboxylase [Candidatus Micrarchaeota archaeon CG1_02_47_40]|nr:MAG: type III ribulose-bisphosphate carboxylase [Candidatus Micrarchaeota archaeon CG1_02_47_40]
MAYGGYSKYVDLRMRVEPEKYLTAVFYVEPAKGKSLVQAAEAVAAESSIGTWVKLSTMQDRVLQKLQAKVFEINRNGIIKIAYPLEIFENGNAPQLLSDIAGNIFGMKEVENIRLLDFEAPKKYVQSFPGPAFGVEGIRKIAGTLKERRPHIGTIVKPKVGLTPKENAAVAYEAWMGGCDFVKDDENLTSHSFSPFEERVVRVLEAADKAEAETGAKKMYAPNITASADVMLKRAEFVKAQGGNCIMVDVITAGFAGVQFIRGRNLGMCIHAHRAMHAAFGRNKRHGIAMKVIAKISRMCGTDQLHIGGIVGKMEGDEKEVREISREMRKLGGCWRKMKPVFSVCSGGLSPLSIPFLYKTLGRDIIIQAGGGVHGHPDGTRAGAIAMRQALDASMRGVSLKEYAKGHEELRKAVEKFGK